MADLRWRKSSYSGSMNECVECAVDGDRRAVRDSKTPGDGVLTFGDREWAAFLADLKTTPA